MTIAISALRDGHAAMAVDSWASGDGDGRDVDHKFLNIDYDDVLISFAGCYRVAQIAEDVIVKKNPFGGKFDYWDVKKFANDWLKEIMKWPHGYMAETSTANFGTDLMITSRQSIYIVHGDFHVTEHGDWACIGQEREGNLSMNLLYGDKRKKLSSIVRDAVGNVCKFLDECGGKIHVREL